MNKTVPLVSKQKEIARLDKIFGSITFLLLGICTFLAFSGAWIAKDVIAWQTHNLSTEAGKYQPVITLFILLMPPLLFLLPVKLFFLKKAQRRAAIAAQ